MRDQFARMLWFVAHTLATPAESIDSCWPRWMDRTYGHDTGIRRRLKHNFKALFMRFRCASNVVSRCFVLGISFQCSRLDHRLFLITYLQHSPDQVYPPPTRNHCLCLVASPSPPLSLSPGWWTQSWTSLIETTLDKTRRA